MYINDWGKKVKNRNDGNAVIYKPSCVNFLFLKKKNWYIYSLLQKKSFVSFNWKRKFVFYFILSVFLSLTVTLVSFNFNENCTNVIIVS